MTRWWIFNTVGLLGVFVQLAVLRAMVDVLNVPYLIATAIAVEAAVVHNFWWHERWTWRERTSATSVWTRLAAFHAANGAISFAGNLVLMRVLVGTFHVPLVVASVIAILACSTMNFAAGETIVYRRAPR
jgi:putative flippase GtrA